LIRDTFSSIDSITLAWIRKVIVAVVLGLVAGATSHVLFLFVIKFGLMYLFSPLAAVFSVYYVSYKAFHQPDVFLMEKPPLFQIEEIDPGHPKYEKSCISDEESKILMSRLEKAMKEKRPYADPELTLAKLASLLPASHHHLSQLLNQRLKKSFYNYINGYRVEQVMSCLADPVCLDTSILDIAFDCGFNSKSTFNKIFKQHTSLSPSQFRERASRYPTR
jgi:AraC-like DNA-binding protein